MKLRPSLRSLTLSLLMLSATVSAQVPQVKQESELPQVKQESDEEKAKARKELERKALALLDDTLQSAQALKLTENRAAVRAQAADLIWTRDEKRARALYREAVSDIIAAQNAEGAMRERGWILSQLRSQLLYAVASRDAQFALELLRESRPKSDEGGSMYGDPEQELRMEQALAALAAESDPKAALRMAEESLSKGVTYGTLSTLDRLRRKDSESATRLAGELVSKLKGENLSARPEAAMVAVSLLRSVLNPQSSEQVYYGGPRLPVDAAAKPKPLTLEDGDVRDLVDVVSGAALNNSTPGGGFGLVMQLRPLLPEIEKRLPARAAQLRKRIAEMDSALDPRIKSWMQYDSVMSKPPDAILEEAAKAPAEMKSALLSAAAMKLVQSGEAERARQVVAENMRGQERDNMLALIDRNEVGRSIEKGDTDAAKAVALRIKSKERRAAALAELAVAFASKGDRKSALQFLEEARSLIDIRPDNEKEVGALLEVARGYALVEPSKTFELIDPLVDEANDMLTAAALLEKFGAGGGLFRKGEIILPQMLDAAGGVYARYIKALSELARVDFERTKTTADRFNRDDVRLAARLVVARSVLSDRLDAAAAQYGGFGLAGVVGGGSAVVIAQ